MTRPHIEFVQTQNIAWAPQGDGTEIKLLNADPDDGAETAILRYPAGFTRSDQGPEDRAEEYFILDGGIISDGTAQGFHGYGFTPRGASSGVRTSTTGATLLVFRHGRSDPNSIVGVSDAMKVDPLKVPWDMAASDPNIAHLQIARKVLRFGPNDSLRTYLLLGLPHGLPAETMPAEKHDHFEEMLMLQGEMWTPRGMTRPGAYFYRPPHIDHGPHVAVGGFLQIMRAGANYVRTTWSEPRALPIGNSYAPIMPENAPDSWKRRWVATPSW